jgi:hypothetical protein
VAGLVATLALAAADQTAPAVERVAFPAGYQQTFHVVRIANKTEKTLLGTIYANDAAASVKESSQLPYPAGAVIVMEWAEPLRDANGTLLTDAEGLWRKGRVVRVDVMQRGAGYGAAYGDKRSGEWEFASYAPDGSSLQPSATAASCAECHRRAGPARDFVFRGRFPPAEKN